VEGLARIPSSYPSLDEYEGTQIADNLDAYGEGIFGSTLDEDPFVTGRFCDNAGQTKQFLFKYSNNNSKNSTMRTGQHFLN